MRTGRPKDRLVISPPERKTLERWASRPKTAQALAQRARIVLACAQDQFHTAIATQLSVTPQTVGKWRSRFQAKRLDGLLDEPRPGAPRCIQDEHVEKILTKTLESTPRDATQWSTRSMAEACGLSQSSVSHIWRAFALQPHRSETFKLSKDPLFIEKVRDIVGLYLHPLSFPRFRGHYLKGGYDVPNAKTKYGQTGTAGVLSGVQGWGCSPGLG